MAKVNRLDKVPREEVLRRVNEEKQILNFGNGNIDGLTMFWDSRLLHELIEGRMRDKAKEEG